MRFDERLPVVLRSLAGRPIVNKTELTGSYFLVLDAAPATLGTGDATASAVPTRVPSVFTAVVEQLGLRLAPSRAQMPAWFIDRLERPSEN